MEATKAVWVRDYPPPPFPPTVALYKSPLLTFCTTDEDPRIETSCFNVLFAVICSSNYLPINSITQQ